MTNNVWLLAAAVWCWLSGHFLPFSLRDFVYLFLLCATCLEFNFFLDARIEGLERSVGELLILKVYGSNPKFGSQLLDDQRYMSLFFF